jgi:hypothetical protein
MRRLALLFGLAVTAVFTAKAHDPYEIASVVYIQSNRIEVFMEMEFATGMMLAGQKPSRDVAAASRFGAAQSQLEQFLGGLLEVTAGNNVMLPLRTNVELGVETHIRGQLEFALTDYRPLSFVPRGLRAVQDAPYGVSLTVLDMVNRKVLGQAALFADSPPADFPATVSTLNPLAGPTLAVVKTDEPTALSVTTNRPARPAEANKPGRPRLLAALAVFASVAILLVAWRRSHVQ